MHLLAMHCHLGVNRENFPDFPQNTHDCDASIVHDRLSSTITLLSNQKAKSCAIEPCTRAADVFEVQIHVVD